MTDLLSPIAPHSRQERTIIGIAAVWAVLLLVLDQVTKVLIEQFFHLHESCVVIEKFFAITYVTNRGAAWGILHGQGVLLLAIAIVVSAAMCYFLRTLCEGYIERYFALFTILSGVIGNSIDRVWRGAVVDFLDFNLFGYAYPAFNVADMAICCGVGVYILSSLLRRSPDATAEPDKEQ